MDEQKTPVNTGEERAAGPGGTGEAAEKGLAAPGNKRAARLSVAALFVVTIIWGWGFIFSQTALDAGLTPPSVLFGRFTLATVVTGLFFRKTIRQHYKKGQWKSGVVIGVLLFGGFLLQITALQYTTPANNAFITGTYVVLVPLIWWIITRKRPGRIVFLSCLLSFSGAAVLSISPGAGLRLQLGDSLTLVCALLFAGHIVATSLMAASIHPTVLVFMQFAVAAVLSLGMFLVTGQSFRVYANPMALGSVAYLGLMSTFTCYFLQTLAQRHLSSAKTGIIMATEALFGALFSVVVGYDVLSARMVVGGLLMFASILLPELAAARREAAQKQ